MIFLGRMVLICSIIVLMIGNVSAREGSENYYRSFWLPTFHGERLSYCSLDGKECGLAVANRYCQMMGYPRANQQIIDYNVGLTNSMPIGRQCVGWRCNGFKTISCVAKMSHRPPRPYHYRLRRFPFPRFGNYRIDWCYDGTHGCGRRAAFSFCRRMGYLDVRHYTMQAKIAATKAIGNQKLCFGNQCNAFENISCFR